MSNQTGRKDLDGYLRGDSALSEAYAMLDKAMPPDALDDAVMKSARRAVHASETRSSGGRRRQWIVPASLVAVALISFTVVMRAVLDPFALEADPAAGEATPATLERLDNTNPSLVYPAAPAAATERPGAIVDRPHAPQERIDLRALAPRGIAGQGTTDPGRWLEQIEALANDGNLDEAQAELERFRDTYPDHSVDAELQQLSR